MKQASSEKDPRHSIDFPLVDSSRWGLGGFHPYPVRTGVPTGHPPALYADDDGQRSLRWEFVRLRHVLSRAGTVLGFPVGEPSVEFHTLEVAHNHGVLGDGIWFPISG